MDPRAPPSKRLRTDMGPYPGGVPYLTDKYINNDGQINKTPGFRTNGSIRITVHTYTDDQDYINVDQFAFLDISSKTKPVMMSIQQLNYWLITEAPRIFIQESKMIGYYDKNSLPKTSSGVIQKSNPDAERAYLEDRFKILGVVANREPVDSASLNRERTRRTFTCTVRGWTTCLDYWSSAKNALHPYDSCFFVLRKVMITPEMKFQSSLSGARGMSAPADVHGTYQWQILPVNSRTDVCPLEKYTWEEKGREYIGTYWRVGHVRELSTIQPARVFSGRGVHTVAQDMNYLHNHGGVFPLEFYLRLDQDIKN